MADRTAWSHPQPFRLRLTDGRVWHGAEFADGFVCVHHPDEINICTIALSLEDLLSDRLPEHPMHGAVVEHPDD